MKIRKLVAPVAALAIAGALVAAPSGANGQEAVTFQHLVGYSGGTAIKALGSTVESDLTAESSVDTTVAGPGQFNTVAGVTLKDIATVAAVSTSATTDQLDNGDIVLVSVGQTAGINLLGGAIKANAVTTTDTAIVHPNGNVDWSVHTEFVGLSIAHVHLPVTIPQNFHVSIPGIATVILNAGFAGSGGPGSGNIMTEGAGLYLSLLKGRGNSPLGTEIFLNPTYSAIGTVSAGGGSVIGGYAYGSKIVANAGNLLNIYAGPSAQISLPINGTNGFTTHNTTATASIPQVLLASAITDYAEGIKAALPAKSESTMTTQLLNLNLLGGLITAEALTGVAHVESTPTGGTIQTATTQFVNLVIAGIHIPISVSPNTVINLANIGTVTIRKQITAPHFASVTLLDIHISTASFGLPVGADVTIGYAQADVFPF
jgi:hypothetical protein